MVARRVLLVAAAAATVAVAAAAAGIAGGERAGAATGSPQVAISPSSVSFGSQRVGSIQRRSVSVENVGNAPLHVHSVVVNDFSGTYSLSFSTCGGATVPPGGLCQFSIESHPRMAGTHSSYATVSDDASGGSQSVPIWGTATAQ
jgi:hypothetical protein